MARHYLSQLPELYFLKSEYAALLGQGDVALEELRKTEGVCLEILMAMLALRKERFGQETEETASGLLPLYTGFPEHRDQAKELGERFRRGTLLDCFL